ncbi:MarR family winged helix-turn-helix transcriptional regulator [Actinoplanes sp. DH11]|uniref:MarR family winged helix-turn-helix transcriptional regulator n=1 Tax=Actinoplanes sp. DH11 TaxID=2857011 RepID=UPI001E65155B|nr:MarR family transcriptional regulator [Actinoplanes sp. DH11]
MKASTALDDMICFQLYAASRGMTALYRPLLDPHHLTYPQYLVLRVLWHDGPTTVRDLGRALALDSGTLSPLLKRLETQGFVHRLRDPGDERVVVVHPTAEGTALREQLDDLTQRLICATGLTLDELSTLHHLLHKARNPRKDLP